ncbi:hypothetical protein PHMEG_00012080 [Phytophthora megakarya]|uniref:Uncharacterized protein n=1 Tax=Phytophthora megakarya TaxID=4795 RepID=A0A225W9M7_9STRA|nr:hypothetical protein PHMEG_00012080 [Phytophthora megakarya]
MCGSKRSGCRMKIKLSAVDKNRLNWRWAVGHHKSGSVEHNHLPSRDVRIHAAHRQRAAKDASSAPVSNTQDRVRAQPAAGIAVAYIHASLLATDNDSLVIPKDFSNVKNAIHSFIATYYDAVNADTEAEFESQRKLLASKSQVLATYLDLHWWKYKERVVRCWTMRYRHFGYQVTFQVEGTHAKCKRWLQISRGSLLTVF